MSKRKILIISHNPLSETDNMGKTIKNLFSSFNKDELCQLYLRNQEPLFSRCKSFYCFNESNILKSIIFRKTKTGKVVYSEDFKLEQKSEKKKHSKFLESIYQFGRKRNQFIYIIRNTCWTLGKWLSTDLINWLNEQKPTCIFFFAGDYSFLFKIVLKISKMYNIPIYSYYVDEYYFNKTKMEFIPLEGFYYKRIFKKLFEVSNMNFCISEKMKLRYEKEFNKPVSLLMNTASNISNEKNNFDKSILKMNYFGNLSNNRWKNLSEISSCIHELNKIHEKRIEFCIYSNEKNDQILKPFLSNQDVNFGGSLSPSEVALKIQESDILVHTESFDKLYREKVEYSLSTKIPESLASGKLFLIYGPVGVESVDYLARNNAAYVINGELRQSLEQLYSNEDFSLIINNALNLINNNHSINKTHKLLDFYLK